MTGREMVAAYADVLARLDLLKSDIALCEKMSRSLRSQLKDLGCDVNVDILPRKIFVDVAFPTGDGYHHVSSVRER